MEKMNYIHTIMDCAHCQKSVYHRRLMTTQELEGWYNGTFVEHGAYRGFEDLFSESFPLIIRLDQDHVQINNLTAHEGEALIPPGVPIYDSPDKIDREAHALKKSVYERMQKKKRKKQTDR